MLRPSSSVSIKATRLSSVFNLIREVVLMILKEGNKEKEFFWFKEAVENDSGEEEVLQKSRRVFIEEDVVEGE